MKIVSRPVEMIAWFHRDKWPEPVKFRLLSRQGKHQEEKIIKVDRITEVKEEKKAGIRSYVYRCQSCINGKEMVYELQYLVEECRWRLYKF